MEEIEPRHTRPLPRPVMRTLPDGSREWRAGPFLHRDDGPAVERPDGSREWWQRGERHRGDPRPRPPTSVASGGGTATRTAKTAPPSSTPTAVASGGRRAGSTAAIRRRRPVG